MRKLRVISSWIYKYPPAPKVAVLEAAGPASVAPAQLVAEELRLAYERGYERGYRESVQDVGRWALDAVVANLSERGAA